MSTDQAILGIAVAILCIVAIRKDRWLLEQTKKGQRLARWLGPDRGLWAIRLFFGCGIVFGLLLALNIIQPVRW